MSEHEEYPMVMRHPAYTPARSEQVPGTGRYTALGELIPGSAAFKTVSVERFAPVLVQNEEQMELHRVQGYEPAGRSDPASFAKAVATPLPPNYEPDRFPMWIGDVLVNNAEEEAAARGTPQIEAANGLTGPDPEAIPAYIQKMLDDAAQKIFDERAQMDQIIQDRVAAILAEKPKIDKRSKAYKAQQAAEGAQA